MQSQEAVSAHFTSKQILPFNFAEQYSTPSHVIYYLATPYCHVGQDKARKHETVNQWWFNVDLAS